MATLAAIYVNAHLKEGSASKSPVDFMPYCDPWPSNEPSRYSDVDREVMAALGVRA